MGRLEKLEQYIVDLEEECENLSEYNRLLVIRIQDLEKEVSELKRGQILDFREQAEKFGLEDRIIHLVEECSELIQAGLKFRRYVIKDTTLTTPGFDLYANLTEEMADVYLLMDEIKHLLKIPNEEIVKRMDYKLRRTEGRIKGEEEAEKSRKRKDMDGNQCGREQGYSQDVEAQVKAKDVE